MMHFIIMIIISTHLHSLPDIALSPPMIYFRSVLFTTPGLDMCEEMRESENVRPAIDEKQRIRRLPHVKIVAKYDLR